METLEQKIAASIAASDLQPSPPDARDFIFVASGVQVPADIDNGIFATPARDQLTLGSCTGFGITGDADATCALHGITGADGLPLQFSPLFVYNRELVAENRTTDGGAFPRDAYRVGNKIGFPVEASWPYDIDRLWNTPPPEVFTDAANHKIDSYYRIPLQPSGDIESMLANIAAIDAALADGARIGVGMWARRWFTRITGDFSHHLNINTSLSDWYDVIGGHFPLIVGKSDTFLGGVYFIRNSWGPGWANKGYAAISKTLVADFFECWVTRGFMGTHMPYKPEQTAITRLYVALFGRAPDASGLDYWTGRLAAGETVIDLANVMFGLDVARPYYPAGASKMQIIRQFYANVLGRIPDPDGLTYWANYWNTDALFATPGTIISNMVQAVVNYTGNDPQGLMSQALFNNKVDIGNFYAATLRGNDIPTAEGALLNVTADVAGLQAIKSALRAATPVIEN